MLYRSGFVFQITTVTTKQIYLFVLTCISYQKTALSLSGKALIFTNHIKAKAGDYEAHACLSVSI